MNEVEEKKNKKFPYRHLWFFRCGTADDFQEQFCHEKKRFMKYFEFELPRQTTDCQACNNIQRLKRIFQHLWQMLQTWSNEVQAWIPTCRFRKEQQISPKMEGIVTLMRRFLASCNNQRYITAHSTLLNII